MTRIMLMAILAAATAGLVRAHATGQRPQGQRSRDDEDAIRQAIVEMTAAFNRHDPNASLFTRDADFVDVRGRWLKGAAEIERERKVRFETVQREARVRQLDLRIRFVTPDVAIAHVTNEISGMIGSDGTTVTPQRELNLRVFTKVNGRWLITAFHSASMGPAERPR